MRSFFTLYAGSMTPMAMEFNDLITRCVGCWGPVVICCSKSGSVSNLVSVTIPRKVTCPPKLIFPSRVIPRGSSKTGPPLFP